MVQVFHWNRRLLRCKLICVVATVILLFIHTFEITYHFIHPCTKEPIDVVYTWVNGSDPKFQAQLGAYLRKSDSSSVDPSSQRYNDKNELKFSLRSLEKFAPWVNHVYIVTNGQIPQWLNLDYEKVSLVTHQEIFEDTFNLPTFSSPAIEANLHRIPGLSKRFIYFNDDVFLRSPVYLEDFVSSNRGFLIYLAWLLPNCAPECSWLYVADGHCDDICNNIKCQKDGGDCDDAPKPLLGDVIVKFDDYEAPETNYDKILASLKNTSTNYNLSLTNLKSGNISAVISEHNKNVILLDKIRRRKVRKKLKRYRTYVDAYGDSLQHTNRVLNEHYGFSVRKVPAHAPIMIDREIMGEMQGKFRKYLQKTVRNRIRSVDDLQFSFSYYYFVIHEKTEMSVEQIFDQFDTDSSGIWSDSEIRTVVTKLYDLPITDEVFAHFTHILVNCSSLSDLPTLQVTKTFVAHCLPLAALLKLHFGVEHKYKFEMIKDAEKKFVAFKMLNSNVTHAVNQLDDVRKNARKFVCLNDNLDQIRTSDNQIIERLMLDFYLSLFPTPSKFELPEDYRNRFLYMEDYVSLINQQQKRLILTCILLIVIVFILFMNFCRRKVCNLIEKCFC